MNCVCECVRARGREGEREIQLHIVHIRYVEDNWLRRLFYSAIIFDYYTQNVYRNNCGDYYCQHYYTASILVVEDRKEKRGRVRNEVG